MHRVAVLLVGSLLIESMSGCASMTGFDPYPASLWGQLDPGRTPGGCPILTGTYSNAASASFPPGSGAAPTLAVVFARMAQAGDPLNPGEGGQDWNVPPDAQVVIIDQTAERLTVSFIDEKETAHTVQFRRYHFDLSETRFDDLFTCYAGDDAARLRFFPELGRSVGASDFYARAGATLVFLLRGADGSLVVQLRSEAVGLSLVVVGSYAGLSSVWYRYPAASGR